MAGRRCAASVARRASTCVRCMNGLAGTRTAPSIRGRSARSCPRYSPARTRPPTVRSRSRRRCAARVTTCAPCGSTSPRYWSTCDSPLWTPGAGARPPNDPRCGHSPGSCETGGGTRQRCVPPAVAARRCAFTFGLGPGEVLSGACPGRCPRGRLAVTRPCRRGRRFGNGGRVNVADPASTARAANATRAASTARAAVLARVRDALRDRPVVTPVPRHYRTAGTAGADVLVDRLEDYRATVRRCAGTQLSTVVATEVAEARRVVVPAGLPEAWLTGYTGEVLRDGEPEPIAVADLDAAGVSVLTGCAVAIAETGTIVLDAGPDQGRRVLTLVPDHHVCVVHIGQI